MTSQSSGTTGLDYWRETDRRLIELGNVIGIDLEDATELAFEHATPVPSGHRRGKASFTDGGCTTTQMLCTDHDVLLSILRGFEPVVSQSYHGTLTDATAAISVSTRPCVTSYSTKASWFPGRLLRS
jgi:hypothetical protein